MNHIAKNKANLENIKKLIISFTGCSKDGEILVKEIKIKEITIAYFLYLDIIPQTGYAIYLPRTKIINFYAKSGDRIKAYQMPDGFKEIESMSENLP